MARITVEDCLRHVNNRFDLVTEAATRARQLSMSGAEARLPWENDKSTVMALREIAAGYKINEEEMILPTPKATTEQTDLVAPVDVTTQEAQQ